MSWTMLDAPSDRDYYEQFCIDPEPDEEPEDAEDDFGCPQCNPNPCRCLYDDEADLDLTLEDD